MALDCYQKAPNEAALIMANREGISVEEFKQTLGELKILDKADQQALFKKKETLAQSVKEVCQTLVHIKLIEESCDTIPNIIYQARP